MANIELVTSHQGAPHITTDQVIDLLAGFSGDISGINRFNLDNDLEPTVTSGLQITVDTGQGLAGGYFFQLLQAYVWELDPLAVGYSRIDDLYIVIYEDQMTTVQSCDFVYAQGTPFVTGQAGSPPPAPSGSNIKATFLFLRANVISGLIDSFTDYAKSYISNASLASDNANMKSKIAALELNASTVRAVKQLVGTLTINEPDVGDNHYKRVVKKITIPHVPAIVYGCWATVNTGNALYLAYRNTAEIEKLRPTYEGNTTYLEITLGVYEANVNFNVQYTVLYTY
jgi:hypothetical protein